MAQIAILGTLDTKGEEHEFLAGLISSRGHTPRLIDVGGRAAPTVVPQVTREAVAQAAGIDLDAVLEKNDRGALVAAMSTAAAAYIQQAHQRGELDGIISLGGSGGTAIACSAMRVLPIGFPKVMVSTMASGDVQPYVREKDIVMVPSIVDVAGLNRFSRLIFTRATGALCGMLESEAVSEEERPIIVASMFGNTTECVQRAKAALEAEGFEVLVFHATGTGGRTMESLIASGLVAGVFDVTTTEWADEYVGGILGAGPDRLTAAARHGVPAVVAPGCVDMVNFGEPDSVPAQFAGRQFYQHNPQVTLMRTSVEESRGIGKVIASKLNASTGPVSLLLPTKALSVIGAPGESFHLPEADEALFAALRQNLREGIEVKEFSGTINDAGFVDLAVKVLLEHLRSGERKGSSFHQKEEP